MINLIVADDHVVMRQALCEMLQRKGTFKVLAEASNGDEVLELLKSHRPDLIILDMAMPKLDGVATLERLNAQGAFPPVLVLSANEGDRQIRAVLKLGAKGYVPKNTGISELEFAINSILSGNTYLSPSITSALMKSTSEGTAESPLSVLTKRELEILKYLADGLPNREIGKLLHISTRTVDTHRSNILKKLKVRTNAELVKLAISHGVISV